MSLNWFTPEELASIAQWQQTVPQDDAYWRNVGVQELMAKGHDARTASYIYDTQYKAAQSGFKRPAYNIFNPYQQFYNPKTGQPTTPFSGIPVDIHAQLSQRSPGWEDYFDQRFNELNVVGNVAENNPYLAALRDTIARFAPDLAGATTPYEQFSRELHDAGQIRTANSSGFLPSGFEWFGNLVTSAVISGIASGIGTAIAGGGSAATGTLGHELAPTGFGAESTALNPYGTGATFAGPVTAGELAGLSPELLAQLGATSYPLTGGSVGANPLQNPSAPGALDALRQLGEQIRPLLNSFGSGGGAEAAVESEGYRMPNEEDPFFGLTRKKFGTSGVVMPGAGFDTFNIGNPSLFIP